MAFAKFEENQFRIDGEIAENHAILVNLTASINTKHLYDFMQCWTNVENVWLTLYKCYTNVLCLLGCRGLSLKHCTFIQCWFNVGPALQMLA